MMRKYNSSELIAVIANRILGISQDLVDLGPAAETVGAELTVDAEALISISDTVEDLESQISSLEIELSQLYQENAKFLEKIRQSSLEKVGKQEVVLEEKTLTISPPPENPEVFGPHCRKIEAIKGRKIEAIKALRILTNLGLKEAKDAIEVCINGKVQIFTYNTKHLESYFHPEDIGKKISEAMESLREIGYNPQIS